MKNLLERLKPEYLELLEIDFIKYPSLIGNIKTDLSKHFHFTELNVNTAFQICNFCKIGFGIVELDSLFQRYE
jgi:hypothetical protein